MKGSTKKLLAVVAAILLVAIVIVPGIGAIRSSAAGSNYDSDPANRTEAATLKATSFDKLFQIRNDCNIPASTFTYTVSAGAKADATSSTLAVVPGVIPGLKMTSYYGDDGTAERNAVAGTTDTTVSNTITYVTQERTASPVKDAVTMVANNPDNEHYTARKTMKLDFTNVAFTEPGVYRYIITEDTTSTTNVGVAYGTPTTRTLDVYVEDASTATAKLLKITGYVLYSGTVTAGPSNSDTETAGTTTAEDGSTINTNGMEVTGATKSVGFVNKYPSASLYFGKEVKGNQGSLDKYFEYELTITGGTPGAILGVNYALADQKITTAMLNSATTKITAEVEQPLTITLGNNGSATQKFYLQDGQYIVVNGFSENTVFSLKEEKEDYTQAFGIDASDSPYEHDAAHTGNDEMKDGMYTASTGVITGTFTEDSTSKEINSFYTGFTNTRNGVIPTGVILSVAPWVIAGIVILAGVVFFAIKSRKRFEEE